MWTDNLAGVEVQEFTPEKKPYKRLIPPIVFKGKITTRIASAPKERPND